jgi:hypothetical protein
MVADVHRLDQIMKKATKATTLLTRATKRNEQGMHAMTILNKLKRGAKVPDWAVKGAGIRVASSTKRGA